MTRARMIATAAIIPVLPFFVGSFGWWVLPVGAAYVGYARFVDYRYGVSEWGETWMFSLTLVTQVMFSVGAVMTGGPESPALVWLILATAIAPARYTLAGVAFVLVFTLAGLSAAALSAGIQTLLDHPELPLATLSTAIGCTACGIAARRSELVQRHAAAIDPLTGLYNRSSLARRYDELRAQTLGTEKEIAFIICDLDRFKDINDQHGHATGDTVLRDAARSLRRVLPIRAYVFRLGGEEFGALMTAESVYEASANAELIRAAIAAARPGGLDVTASVGVTVAGGSDATIDDLFAVADAAMYEAKASGRNRTVTSPPSRAGLRAIAGGAT